MRKFVKLKVIFSTAILLTSAFVLEAMSPEEVMPPELKIPEERTYLESEAIKRGRETMIFFHENLCNFQKSCKEMYHPYEKNIEAWYQNYIRMVSSILKIAQEVCDDSTAITIFGSNGGSGISGKKAGVIYGGSCTSNPIPCPIRCVKNSP